MQTNSFISLLRKIPVLYRLIPVSLYRQESLKKFFILGGLAKGFIGAALGSTLRCLFLFSWIPSLLLITPTPTELLTVYLLVECLVPAITSCSIFRATERDYVFLNHFMLNPGEYYHYKIGKEIIEEAVVKLPMLVYLLGDTGLVAMAVFAEVFYMLGGCCLYLFLYDRLHGVVKKSVRSILGWVIRIFAYVGLKFSVFGSVIWEGPVCVLLCIGMLLCSVLFYFCLLKYQDYKRIAVQFANKEAMTITITTVNSATEGENGLKPWDWKENREYFLKNSGLSRAVYMNQTFLKRFHKIFSDQRKQIFILSIPLGLLCGYFIRIGILDITEETILNYTPMLIPFVSSCMLFGSRFTELCFRFVDMPMMYHGICEKEYLKQSIRYRYLFLVKHSLVALLGLAMFIILVLGCSGIRIPVTDIIFILIAMELYMLINESYKLLIYYWIQPYTTDVSVKSPVFKLLGIVESLFDISVLFVRGNLVLACLPLLGIFVVINVLMLWMQKNVHKTFRLRY